MWCWSTTLHWGTILCSASSSLPLSGGTPPRQGTHCLSASCSVMGVSLPIVTVHGDGCFRTDTPDLGLGQLFKESRSARSRPHRRLDVWRILRSSSLGCLGVPLR